MKNCGSTAEIIEEGYKYFLNYVRSMICIADHFFGNTEHPRVILSINFFEWAQNIFCFIVSRTLGWFCDKIMK